MVGFYEIPIRVLVFKFLFSQFFALFLKVVNACVVHQI